MGPGERRGYVRDVGPVRPPGERPRSGVVVMLAVALVAGWLVIRLGMPAGPPAGTPGLPTPTPGGSADASPSGATMTALPTWPAPPGPGAVLAGTWRQTAPAPLAGRTGHVLAWTGTEVIVWGGTASRPGQSWIPRDGAGYNPGSDTWRPIPAAPLPGRERFLAAWSGTELLVWGGTRPSGLPDAPLSPGSAVASPGPATPVANGAAYDPAADSWRWLPPVPLSRSDAVGGWLGGSLFVVTSDGAASYQPRDDAWTSLAPAPVRPGGRVGVVAAGEVVVIAFGDGSDGLVEGAVLDPGTGAWTVFGAPFLTLHAGLTFVAAADQVLVPEPRFQSRNLFLRGGLVMERQSWRPVEPCPGAARGATWTGRYVIGVEAAFDMVTGECLALPPAPPRAAPFGDTNGRDNPVGVWTGTEYITWSGAPSGEVPWVPNDGAAFRPDF